MDEIENTGTYQMILATKGGPTILEERARRLAREARKGCWQDYLDAAREQLLAEEREKNEVRNGQD